MSYSFSIRAASKAAAVAKVAEELAKVVARQAVHTADQAQAQQAAESFIALLPDDDTQDVSLSMSGYVGGVWSGVELQHLHCAAVSVSCSLQKREEQAQA